MKFLIKIYAEVYYPALIEKETKMNKTKKLNILNQMKMIGIDMAKKNFFICLSFNFKINTINNIKYLKHSIKQMGKKTI